MNKLVIELLYNIVSGINFLCIVNPNISVESMEIQLARFQQITDKVREFLEEEEENENH